jgi:NAD(P)-dependent dehydrogenase (short-subunit alcohol dehydrogenase family)
MEIFDRVIKVNVTGTFNTLRLVAHQMSTQPLLPNNERGVIINTASVAGYEAQRGHTAYGASKSAVIAMTLPVARDLSHYNIRVVTIAPGLFLTPMSAKLPDNAMKIMTPHSLRHRFGAPEEYALAIKFVAENSYVNGSILRIDGGMRSPHI